MTGTPSPARSQPIPHWPGELVSLGDHRVYVRSVTAPGEPAPDEAALCVHGLEGSIRTLTAETLRVGQKSAWRNAARITAPTLVIYGSHDRLVDPRMAGRAARAFRDGRIVVLPRTGHVAHMEHPGAVAAEIGLLAGRTREFPLAPVG